MRERALAWVWREPELLADRIELWEHGTVYRASRYPRYSNVNVLRVTDDPGMSAEELMSFADQALAGLRAQRIEFDCVRVAEPLRAGFAAHGFRCKRLVWMRFVGSPPDGAQAGVAEVAYDEAGTLRRAWEDEEYPSVDVAEYLAQAREVRLRLGNRTLALYEDSVPVGFAALDPGEDETELAALYVLPEFRGGGRGTRLAKAAIAAAGPVHDLWICADDEDRPKHLYERLGFKPVLTMMQFLRLPRVS